MAVWVEEISLPAPGMENEDNEVHSRCDESEECLPFGRVKACGDQLQLDRRQYSASRMVPQVMYRFYRKPMAPQRLLVAESAQSWQQKRTSWTQEVIRRLLRTRKQLSCKEKKTILSECMQLMKNSSYSAKFRREVFKAGIAGYSKIYEDDVEGRKLLYRTREWRKSSTGMEAQKLRKSKSKRWLGGDYKSCIFVPPTPGSELCKLMQEKEKVMRAGGREKYGIKIIESAGNTLERM